MLGLDPLPWNEWVASDYLEWEFEQRQKAARHALGRDTARTPSRPLADFTGLYRNPAYGEVRIAKEKGALTLRYGQFALSLRHYRGDIFEIVKIPVTSRTHLEVSFALDETGAIVRLAIPFDRDVADIVFLLATPDR